MEETETTSAKQPSDEDALSGVENNLTRQQLEKEDGNDVEPRYGIRLRSSQEEEEEAEEDVGGEDDFTIPVFTRHADLQDCVRSIEQWVRDCHKDQPIENDVFPTDVTIRGTSLLDDLDRLAQLFFLEHSEQRHKRQKGFEDATQLIVETVASIPGFVKTVLLIDKATERMQVMQQRLMKRVLLSHKAVMSGASAAADETEWGTTNNNNSSSNTNTNNNNTNRSSARGGVVLLESWLLTLLDASHEEDESNGIHNDDDDDNRNRNDTLSKRAVDYMEFVSNTTLDDYMLATVSKETSRPGRGGESEAELREGFLEARRVLFDRVATFQHLEALLLTLPEDEMERAASTDLVRWSLYKALKKPFAALMNTCDVAFHTMILVMLRFWLLFDVRFDQGRDTPDQFVSLCSLVAFMCLGYFTFRWIGDVVGLARIRPDLALRWTLSLQTIVHVLLVVLVFITTAGSRLAQKNAIRDKISWDTYSSVAALSLGMVWLKVVLFLQVINRKMAAYILVLIQIVFRDIFFFLVMVFATVVGFGDMLFTLYASDPNFCKPWTVLANYVWADNSNNSTLSFLVWGDDLLEDTDWTTFLRVGQRVNSTHFLLNSDLTTALDDEYAATLYSYPYVDVNDFEFRQNLLSKIPFCRSRRESYYAIYRIYLGNFNLDSYRKTPLTSFLFVLITFLALIIMLNLLIAIIQQSYEVSIGRADRLFSRARLTFVAQIQALEDLLHPDTNHRRHRGGGGVGGQERQRHGRNDYWMHQSVRWVCIAFLFVAAFLWTLISTVVTLFLLDVDTETDIDTATSLSVLLFVSCFSLLGLVPLAVLAINLFVGWDEASAAQQRSSRWARFFYRSVVVRYLYQVPLKYFSGWVLQIPQDENDQNQRLLDGRLLLEAGYSTVTLAAATTDSSSSSAHDRKLASMLRNLEEQIVDAETKLHHRIDGRLSRMHTRFETCLTAS